MAIVTLRSTHLPTGKSRDITTTGVATPQPGDWPNHEPAGHTPILLMNGSTMAPPPGFTAHGFGVAPHYAVVTDPASKYGQAIEKRWFVGDLAGWNGLIQGPIGEWAETYWRFVFMPSQNYQFNTTNTKMVYFDFPAEHFVIWGGERIGFNDFGSGVGEYDIVTDPTEKKSFLRPSRGVYNTLEVHLGASLTPGTGFARFWLNDIEYADFNHRGHPESPFPFHLQNMTWVTTKDDENKRIGGTIQLPWFWGGSGHVKQVNDFVRFSEIYISGRN